RRLDQGGAAVADMVEDAAEGDDVEALRPEGEAEGVGLQPGAVEATPRQTHGGERQVDAGVERAALTVDALRPAGAAADVEHPQLLRAGHRRLEAPGQGLPATVGEGIEVAGLLDEPVEVLAVPRQIRPSAISCS